jgi:hypothetical protein
MSQENRTFKTKTLQKPTKYFSRHIDRCLVSNLIAHKGDPDAQEKLGV